MTHVAHTRVHSSIVGSHKRYQQVHGDAQVCVYQLGQAEQGAQRVD